jgi:hypothetical protein
MPKQGFKKDKVYKLSFFINDSMYRLNEHVVSNDQNLYSTPMRNKITIADFLPNSCQKLIFTRHY